MLVVVALLLQEYVSGEVPPLTELIVAVPVLPPEHALDAVIVPVIGAGCVIVTVPFALHPLLSVIV